MKKLLLLSVLVGTVAPMFAESFTTGGTEYQIVTLIDREIGPGIRYTRLRVPDFPLNVNMLRIDVTNPYNSVETTQANDLLYGTESLVKAAQRQTTDGKRVVAGSNANFWCVSGQPPFSDLLIGLTYNANMRNGKMIAELNMFSDQWNGGYKHTGILGITDDKKVYSNNNFTWIGTISSEKTGALTINTVNKTIRENELGIYNSYFSSSKSFLCVEQYAENNTQHFRTVTGDATEVYLTMDEGHDWATGEDMIFTVKEVKTNAGGGKRADQYDLAIVGRGGNATALANLAIGDKVTMNYGFYNSNNKLIKFKNVVGGNAQVMKNGEMTSYATSESYNSMVYSRTGMGADADHKTLYIIVIDKSTDPVYGVSAGCTTTVMCDLAKIYGCVNMTNFDAGGSAEMYMEGAIINKTTEGSPRAVANGLFAYSIAPKDDVITRLEFLDYELKAPIYSSFTPRVHGFNQYGDLVDTDVKVTLSCPAEVGTCNGGTLIAAGTECVGTLTASYGSVTVTKPITIMGAQMALRVKPLHIDFTRKYPMEITAEVDNNTYTYDPAYAEWTIEDNSIANIDEDGVLTGLKEGTTKITAKIGEFYDETTLTVENASKAFLPVTTDAVSTDNNWKITKSACTVTLEPLGQDAGFTATCKITSIRGTYFKIAKDCQLYSLPDALRFVVNPGNMSVKNMVISLQPANAERAVDVTITPTLTANSDNEVVVDLKEFGDPTDIAFYPATFTGLRFSPDSGTGTYTVTVPSMEAKYNNYTDGIEDIRIQEGEGNGSGPVEFFNLQGVRVNTENAAPGVYISRRGTTVKKVIIK